MHGVTERLKRRTRRQLRYPAKGTLVQALRTGLHPVPEDHRTLPELELNFSARQLHAAIVSCERTVACACRILTVGWIARSGKLTHLLWVARF